MEDLGLSHRPTFRKNYLHPAMSAGAGGDDTAGVSLGEEPEVPADGAGAMDVKMGGASKNFEVSEV